MEDSRNKEIGKVDDLNVIVARTLPHITWRWRAIVWLLMSAVEHSGQAQRPRGKQAVKGPLALGRY
jgi:hypothetical protein